MTQNTETRALVELGDTELDSVCGGQTVIGGFFAILTEVAGTFAGLNATGGNLNFAALNATGGNFTQTIGGKSITIIH